MSLEQIRKDLETYVDTNWSATPVVYENTEPLDFSIAGAPPLTDGDKDYILMEIDIESTTTISVPAECLRHTGYLVMALHVKEDTGAQASFALVDQLDALFTYQRIGSVEVKNRLAVTGSPLGNGWVVYPVQWYFESHGQL